MLDEQLRFKDHDIELVYVVSGDDKYLLRFLLPVVQSIHINAGLRIGLHVHVINATQIVLDLIKNIEAEFTIEIIATYERFVINDLPADAIKTYYTIARFLVLPEIARLHNINLLVADLDQIVIKNLGPLVDNLRDHDVGLLRFPQLSYNIFSLFSASIVLARPNEGALKYLDFVCDYITRRIQELNGEIAWHLDQVALAVAQLKMPDLSWYSIPPATLSQEDNYVEAGASSEAMFWSATASVPNERRLASIRQYLGERAT